MVGRWLLRIGLGLLVLFTVSGGWLWHRLSDYPSLAAFKQYDLRPPADSATPRVHVTFLGVASLLIEDGETALMTDGFFTRPGKMAVFAGKIEPDRALIAATLKRAGVERLAAVIVVHSHYDHGMDAPEVARLTGATVLGSQSTANIARGWQLPQAQIRVVEPGTPMRFGAFTVTLIASRHFPHGMAMGEIDAPLVPPVRATDYREGGSYSVLIEHPLGSLLVQGSAGWVDGALRGGHADVVLLGIGALGSEDATYRDTYYREIVDAVGPRCVIPIHYDDFTLPLDQPLRAMSNLFDDVDGSLRFLITRTQERRIGFGMIQAWEAVPLLGEGRARCVGEPR